MGCDPATAPAPGGVVIAGAGLAGCLAAVTAARQGHQVDVFELRPDSRPDSKAWQGRSINLALSTRGLTALAEVGLAEPVQRLGVPMYGRMLHSVSGETSEQAYGTSRAQHLLSVSRRALNELLCDAVEREPNARLHFQHKILSVDLPGPNRRGRSERDGNEVASASEEPRCGVTVQNVSSGGGMAAQKEVVEAGLLIGADGAWSKVRQSMQRDADTRLDFSLDYCPHSYKELSIPAGADGKHVLPPNFLHIWPRGEFMLIALPDLEGSFTCTLFIPQKQIEAAGLDDDQRPGQRERVASFFDRWFP
jgi:kynurenine 3-monooxygenase